MRLKPVVITAQTALSRRAAIASGLVSATERSLSLPSLKMINVLCIVAPNILTTSLLLTMSGDHSITQRHRDRMRERLRTEPALRLLMMVLDRSRGEIDGARCLFGGLALRCRKQAGPLPWRQSALPMLRHEARDVSRKLIVKMKTADLHVGLQFLGSPKQSGRDLVG